MKKPNDKFPALQPHAQLRKINLESPLGQCQQMVGKILLAMLAIRWVVPWGSDVTGGG